MPFLMDQVFINACAIDLAEKKGAKKARLKERQTEKKKDRLKGRMKERKTK